MKYRVLTRIFGFLFSAGLAVLAYFSLVVGIALSFAGIDWFVAMAYVFAILAVVNIISLFFLKKKPIVTIVINVISTLIVLATIVYLLAIGLTADSPLALILYITACVLGALTTLFAVLAKKKSMQTEM